MRILVIQRMSDDTAVPPLRDTRSGRVRSEWQATEVHPPDARALDLALLLRETHRGGTVTLLHVGEPTADSWLRESLARGCDEAVRVWDDDLAEVREQGMALVYAAAARACDVDLLLLGTASPAEPTGQTSQLVAAELGLPCVTQAVRLAPAEDPAWLEVTRESHGGFHERLEVRLPAVVGVSGPGGETVAPLRALLEAQAMPVAAWDLAEIGLPWEAVRRAESRLGRGTVATPRPGLRRVAAPDSALPAFERIQQLLQGATKRREGRIVRGTEAELVEDVFQTLLSEGWLDHLRPEDGS